MGRAVFLLYRLCPVAQLLVQHGDKVDRHDVRGDGEDGDDNDGDGDSLPDDNISQYSGGDDDGADGE